MSQPSGWKPPTEVVRLGATCILILSLSIGLSACSGGQKPRSSAKIPTPTLPQTTPPTEQSVDESAPAPTPLPSPEAPGRRTETLVILDEPDAEHQPTTLVEAARRAREMRKSSEEPRVKITDENLSQYATGQVTLAEPATPAPEGEGESSAARSLAEDENYWRTGVRRLRVRLRQAVDEAADLKRQIAGLRNRFYAEDDPYVRDGQIKPAWDDALDREREVLEEVRTTRLELDEFLERGHRAGALPGWLREGIELEPELESEQGDAAEDEDLPRHRPQEPVVIDEDEHP